MASLYRRWGGVKIYKNAEETCCYFWKVKSDQRQGQIKWRRENIHTCNLDICAQMHKKNQNRSSWQTLENEDFLFLQISTLVLLLGVYADEAFSLKPQKTYPMDVFPLQAGTTCGASSQPDLIQNHFLIARMLKILRHSRQKVPYLNIPRQKWHISMFFFFTKIDFF